MKSTLPLMFLPRQNYSHPHQSTFLLTYYKDGPQSYFAFDQGLINYDRLSSEQR